MYNLLISMAAAIVIFLAVFFPFNYIAAILPALIVLIFVYIMLAKKSYRILETLMMNMQLEFQRLGKVKNPQLRSIDKAIDILKSGYPLGKWQFMVKSQLDAQIGVIYYTNSQTKKAAPFLKNASMRHWVARAMLAADHFKKEEYDEMEAVFDDALKMNKKVALLYNIYAWCLLQIKKEEKAAAVLQKAVTVLPNDKNLRTSLTNIQNNKKIKLNLYGDEWYQFRLEKHPQELQAKKQMFKSSKKQRIKRR